MKNRQKKNEKKKPLTKRTYIYLGLVTMAAVSLLAKPIKRGFSALERHLATATYREKKANLRKDLDLWSEQRYNEMVNGRNFDESLEDEVKPLKHRLDQTHYNKHELE